MASEITLASAISTANTGLDAIKRAPIVEDNTGIKCLRIQDVSQKKSYDSWGFTKVTPENFKKFQLKKDDIMIARTGGSVGVNLFILNDAQSVFNNGLIRIRTKTEKFFPKYIYYLLQTDSFKSHIEAIAYSTSAQPNMKIRDLLRFTFIEQNLESQEKIAHILSTLDEKIEINRQMNETLEAMAQALFKSWFVDFDPVIDNALAAGKSIPDELIDRAEQRQAVLDSGKENLAIRDLFPDELEFTEELGWIPKGWETKPIYEAANFINGSSFKSQYFTEDNQGLPIIKIAEIKSGISKQTKFTTQEMAEKYAINDGAILFSWSGNPDTSIDTFIWTGGDGWLNQHIFNVVLKQETDRTFVYYLLKYLKPIFTEIARDKQTTGLGHVTVKDMKRIYTIAPSAEVLEAFSLYVNPIFKRWYGNLFSSNELSKIRDTLLPKLLSGELRIPDAERLVDEVL